jgi:uncharacterized membrane protein YdjX (TVP38/TMEM64 family)
LILIHGKSPSPELRQALALLKHIKVVGYMKFVIRLLLGLTIAAIIYQFALEFATGDCLAIQQDIRAAGAKILLLFIATASVLAVIGLPAPLIAAVGGLLFGAFTGGALASTSITLGSLAAWVLARSFFRRGELPRSLESRLTATWYQQMMTETTTSGFHWVVKNAMRCPLPFTYFAAITAAKVNHLNSQSLAGGIYAASFLPVAAYALAGGSIGCAVINHAQGLAIHHYRPSLVISCLVLVFLARFQSWVGQTSGTNGVNQ